MKKYIIAALSVATISSAASALDVHSTAGALPSLVGEPASVAELRLTGTVDASDLFFISREMTSLRTLDLSGVTIAAYSGDKIGGLTSYAAATIPQGVFSVTALTSVVLPAAGNVAVGDFAFAGSALRSVTIGAGVASIGQGAFSDCDELTEVTLRHVATGGYVFKGCDRLAKVNLGGMSRVSASDFADCPALAEVSGGENLTDVGASAFEGCVALSSFDFHPGITSIGASSFSHSGLRAADLSECSRLASVGAWAFAYETALASVVLPAGLASLGEGAFFDCPALASVNIPASCEFIPDYAFKGNTALTEAVVPEGAYEIGRYAWHGASSLTKVTLPASLEYIGDNAMEGLTRLAEVDATALYQVPDLGTDVWVGVNQSEVLLSVQPDMTDAFGAASQWQEFDIRSVSTGADNVASAPGSVSLRARFAGKELQVEASGAVISSLALYDTAGVLLGTHAADAERVAVDTSNFGTNIYIVRCALADGSAATVKIARK